MTYFYALDAYYSQDGFQADVVKVEDDGDNQVLASLQGDTAIAIEKFTRDMDYGAEQAILTSIVTASGNA